MQCIISCCLVVGYRIQRTMVVTPASHCGIHTWSMNVQVHTYAHGAVVENEDTTMYLEQGSAAFSALKSVITACHFLGALLQLTTFHHTGQVEGGVSELPAPRDALLWRYDSSHNCNGTFAIGCIWILACAVLFTLHYSFL